MALSKVFATASLAAAIGIFAATGASATGFGAVAGLENTSPASAVVMVKGRGARNVALGVLGAAAAVAIIAGASNAARAERRRDDYRDRCRFYDRKCDQGENWACRKFDDNCAD